MNNPGCGSIVARIERAWQTRGALACLLWPVSLLYRFIMFIRRLVYRYGLLAVKPSALPIVVVGNLSVGGTGKTPFCAYLVQYFEQAGWRPGIVSRGYGGERHVIPHLITSSDSASKVGDEPLMLYRQTGVPVCVCVERALAVEKIAEYNDIDIVFADDGLQHLAMSRTAEIVVIDGARGFGNGWMLPAGPLREPLSRLSFADLVAVQVSQAQHASLDSLNDVRPDLQENGFSLHISHAISLSDGHRKPLIEFEQQAVVGMAGIGHPERFFDALRAKGLEVHAQARPDHHIFTLEDLSMYPSQPVLVTSKDAVKLKALGKLPPNVYEVPAETMVNNTLLKRIAEFENHMCGQPSAKFL